MFQGVLPSPPPWRCILLQLCRIFGACLVFCSLAFGQAGGGSISGLAIDSTGSAIPGATITVKNVATNVTQTTQSNESGIYRFPSLAVGVYALRGTAEGFQAYERPQVEVQINQVTTVDLAFELGAVTETITVSGVAAPLIQTEQTDVGIVVESKRFLNLPLTLGGGIRNPSSFIKLAPGVSGTSTWNKSVSGGGSFQDQVYYDGISLSRGDLSNDGEVNPPVDSIGEFKLITNNYSAEYSHALGAITSFTLKSGTNDFHGSAWEFFRNDKLDARGFFNSEKAPVRQNEWGVTGGGPVFIPKVYDGRNKTFWFYSYNEFYRRGGQLSGLNTIPTANMQTGDFGELPNTIYDPSTTVQNGDGSYSRDPFPNQIIPESRWSRVTSVMLPYHPKPELPGVTQNSIAPLASPSVTQRHQAMKFNHDFTSNHRWSTTISSTGRPSIKSPGPSRLIPVGDTTALMNYNYQVVKTKVIHSNLDSTINPTTYNRLGFGFSRFFNPNNSLAINQGWTQPNGGMLGLLGLQFDNFPTIQFDTQGYTRYGDNIAGDYHADTYTFLDTLTMIRGKHELKMGFEVQRHDDDYDSQGTGAGDFHFKSNGTGNPQAFGATGDAWASFLLGQVDNASSYFRADQANGRYAVWGMFINDSFKVTPKLTIDMGLRWEIIVPHGDPKGRLSYIDLHTPNDSASGLPGALIFGGDQGFGNRLLNTLWVNPAPRFGFAYKLQEKTVIRAAVGIFNSNYINQGLGLPQTGYATTASFATGNNGVTPAFNWDNGFPQNFQAPPNFSPTQSNGQNGTVVLRDDYSLPTKAQWNLMFERQFRDDIGVSIGYVGNKGTHLYESQNINQIPDAATQLPLNVLRADVNSDLARQYGVVEPFAGFSQLWGARGTVAQALRPYPQFGSLSIYGSTYANSSYHSLQTKINKRYRNGLTGTFAYTFSRFKTDGRMFDGFVNSQSYYQRERSFHPTDRPHVLTFSYNYELPFGEGKRWLNAGGVANVLLGGWTAAGVHSYQSGSRLSVTGNNTLPYFNGGLRPDLVSPDSIRSDVTMGAFDPATDIYLNKAAFALPAEGQYGSSPRYLSNVRGPMYLEESFALFKNTKITERITHQFRFEVANPLNRVVFGNPVTNFAAGNFGRITGTQYTPRNIQFGMKLLW
ncbi:MAG: hypothetical protein GC160_08060 [Acidobacteria bacterium]|nr:hypothetical protein [Acidobacteriota bacterium]